MSDFAIGLVRPRTDEEYQEAIEAMLEEMQRSETKSRQTRARIERLKAETRVIEERSAVIQARTQARLDSLPEWMRTDVG